MSDSEKCKKHTPFATAVTCKQIRLQPDPTEHVILHKLQRGKKIFFFLDIIIVVLGHEKVSEASVLMSGRES